MKISWVRIKAEFNENTVTVIPITKHDVAIWKKHDVAIFYHMNSQQLGNYSQTDHKKTTIKYGRNKVRFSNYNHEAKESITYLKCTTILRY